MRIVRLEWATDHLLSIVSKRLREKGIEILNKIPIVCERCGATNDGKWLDYSLIVNGAIKTFECKSCNLFQSNYVSFDPNKPLTKSTIIGIALAALNAYLNKKDGDVNDRQ